jgi:hypothetical protein
MSVIHLAAIRVGGSNKSYYGFKKALTPGPSPKERGEVLLEPLKEIMRAPKLRIPVIPGRFQADHF